MAVPIKILSSNWIFIGIWSFFFLMRNLSLQKNRIKLAEKEICDYQLRNAEDKELFCPVKVFCIDKCFKLSIHQIYFAFVLLCMVPIHWCHSQTCKIV